MHGGSMKMTRSNAFVVALLFSLAACGGQSRSSGSGTNNGTNVGTNNGTDTGTNTGTNTGGDPGTVTDGGTGGTDGGTGGTGGTDGGTGGTDGGSTGGSTPSITSVTVTGSGGSIVAGLSQQYTAVASYSDSTTQDVTATASWSVDPASLGTVDPLGNFVSAAAGAGTISAAFGGVTGSIAVLVTDPLLLSLSITPSDDSGPLGIDVQFTAMGIFTNGALDLTSAVTWTSSDQSIATISSTGALHPVASGGPITITASSGAITASTSFTVTDAKLIGIDVVPATNAIAQFTTASLQAIGYYSDNTQVDLSDVATWSSSDTSVVALSNGIAYDTGDAIEVAYGAAPGSATVTATFDGVSDSATVTVTTATLQSIAVTPAAFSLPSGLTQQVTVAGTFSDGTTQDLTALAAWSSSDNGVATVSNAMGSTGLVHLVAAGTATITATVDVGAVHLTADASVVVTNAFVVSLAVTGSPTLPVGYKTQFRAIAAYSDGSSIDVTKAATWASSDPTKATISTASPTQGFATGIAVGTTTIAATLEGVVGSTSVTVTNAYLVSLAVSPKTFTIGVGQKQQLTAIGTFSDGTTLDLTTQCQWRSHPKSVAWVSKGGVVTGTTVGSTTIKVRKRNVWDTATATVQ